MLFDGRLRSTEFY